MQKPLDSEQIIKKIGDLVELFGRARGIPLQRAAFDITIDGDNLTVRPKDSNDHMVSMAAGRVANGLGALFSEQFKGPLIKNPVIFPGGKTFFVMNCNGFSAESANKVEGQINSGEFREVLNMVEKRAAELR